MPSRCVQGSCWKAHAIRNRDAETYKGFPWCQVRYQARSIDKYCHTQMRRMWVEESIKKDFMIVCFRTLLTNGWAIMLKSIQIIHLFTIKLMIRHFMIRNYS